MMAQKPHLDYPYYDYLWPEKEDAMKTEMLMVCSVVNQWYACLAINSHLPQAVQFVTLLTNFTIDNGGTAIRPFSHLDPKYPTDVDEFFRNAIQVLSHF